MADHKLNSAADKLVQGSSSSDNHSSALSQEALKLLLEKYQNAEASGNSQGHDSANSSTGKTVNNESAGTVHDSSNRNRAMKNEGTTSSHDSLKKLGGAVAEGITSGAEAFNKKAQAAEKKHTDDLITTGKDTKGGVMAESVEDWNRYDYKRKFMPEEISPERKGVIPLQTGDRLVRAGNLELLIMPNGGLVQVGADGSVEVDNKGERCRMRHNAKSGTTTIEMENGDTVTVNGGRITDVQRGSTRSHMPSEKEWMFDQSWQIKPTKPDFDELKPNRIDPGMFDSLQYKRAK